MATSFTARVVDIASRMESLAQPGGVNVSCAVRDQVRDRLPIAFEDLGEHEVKNTARPVHSFRVVLDKPATPPPSPAPKKVAAPPEKAAVAVLPFQNLGGDAEAQFFLDNVAEDLITELARARWFSVVARNTSFTYITRAKGPMRSSSPAISAFATWSRVVCARRAIAFASPASWSRRRAVNICGPSASTAPSKIHSTCRTRSSKAWSVRSLQCCVGPRSSALGASRKRPRMSMI